MDPDTSKDKSDDRALVAPVAPRRPLVKATFAPSGTLPLSWKGKQSPGL